MKGRFGRGKVNQVLRGSRAKHILDSGLDSLSTYGLLSHWDRDALSRLITECIRTRLIDETRDPQGRYPKVAISDLGLDVIHDRKRVPLDMPSNGKQKAAGARITKQARARVAVSTEDADLFKELRRLRMDLSKRLRRKPYMIFPDKTLLELARLKPRTKAEFAEIPGVGKAKLRSFAKAFLGAIDEFVGQERDTAKLNN
jgi:ATP-dependent DNA helicase RecQ